MCPKAENVAVAIPGINRIERRTSRTAASSASPIDSGAGGTTSPAARVRALTTSVASRGTCAAGLFDAICAARSGAARGTGDGGCAAFGITCGRLAGMLATAGGGVSSSGFVVTVVPPS